MYIPSLIITMTNYIFKDWEQLVSHPYWIGLRHTHTQKTTHRNIIGGTFKDWKTTKIFTVIIKCNIYYLPSPCIFVFLGFSHLTNMYMNIVHTFKFLSQICPLFGDHHRIHLLVLEVVTTGVTPGIGGSVVIPDFWGCLVTL